MAFIGRESLRASENAKAMLQSQVITAQIPNTMRPTAAPTSPEENPKDPEKARSPVPKAIQLPTAAKETRARRPSGIAEPQQGRRVSRKFSLIVAPPSALAKHGGAEEKASLAQSTSHNGTCRLRGPPGIGNRPPTSRKLRTRQPARQPMPIVTVGEVGVCPAIETPDSPGNHSGPHLEKARAGTNGIHMELT